MPALDPNPTAGLCQKPCSHPGGFSPQPPAPRSRLRPRQLVSPLPCGRAPTQNLPLFLKKNRKTLPREHRSQLNACWGPPLPWPAPIPPLLRALPRQPTLLAAEPERPGGGCAAAAGPGTHLEAIKLPGSQPPLPLLLLSEPLEPPGLSGCQGDTQ